jgi:hypothetical protein
MGSLFKKDSTLKQRMERIRRELDLVSGDIRRVSRVADKPGAGGRVPALRSARYRAEAETAASRPAPTPAPGAASGEPPAHLRRAGADAAHPRSGRAHDRRLVDYLAGSFHSVSTLRHEKQIQRNKAIVMVVFVAVLLLLLLSRLLW